MKPVGTKQFIGGWQTVLAISGSFGALDRHSFPPLANVRPRRVSVSAGREVCGPRRVLRAAWSGEGWGGRRPGDGHPKGPLCGGAVGCRQAQGPFSIKVVFSEGAVWRTDTPPAARAGSEGQELARRCRGAWGLCPTRARAFPRALTVAWRQGLVTRVSGWWALWHQVAGEWPVAQEGETGAEGGSSVLDWGCERL